MAGSDAVARALVDYDAALAEDVLRLLVRAHVERLRSLGLEIAKPLGR